MAEEMKDRVVGGERKKAEVDGGYFGGYFKPANLKMKRVDRRFARNQNGKRKVVVIIRERGGNSVPGLRPTIVYNLGCRPCWLALCQAASALDNRASLRGSK
jgi:hypothetical protein